MTTVRRALAPAWILVVGACALSASLGCSPDYKPVEAPRETQRLAASMGAAGAIDVTVSMDGARFEPVHDSDLTNATLVSQTQGPPLSIKLTPSADHVIIEIAFRREGASATKAKLEINVPPGTAPGANLPVLLR